MSGVLTLVPTPIDNESQLSVEAKKILLQAVKNEDLILVEEPKAARRRWLKYGLPREAIESFVYYNEHTRQSQIPDLLKLLGQGKNLFLMSDCGLPAFCDPGQMLVDKCHEKGIKVSSTPFCNSVVLAMALSGFSHQRFVFEGFIPVRHKERTLALKRILKSSDISVLMDTPYRLEKLLQELKDLNCSKKVFLAMDLNKAEETLIRGSLTHILKNLKDFKREFILILGPQL